MAEREPNKPNEDLSNQTVLLVKGISHIRESNYQTAPASTLSAGSNDVANPVEHYGTKMQQYVNS